MSYIYEIFYHIEHLAFSHNFEQEKDLFFEERIKPKVLLLEKFLVSTLSSIDSQQKAEKRFLIDSQITYADFVAYETLVRSKMIHRQLFE